MFYDYALVDFKDFLTGFARSKISSSFEASLSPLDISNAIYTAFVSFFPGNFLLKEISSIFLIFEGAKKACEKSPKKTT